MQRTFSTVDGSYATSFDSFAPQREKRAELRLMAAVLPAQRAR
jgi:hypothetical protein